MMLAKFSRGGNQYLIEYWNRAVYRKVGVSFYSGGIDLASELACVVDESSSNSKQKRPRATTRLEHKKFLELSVKKKVKEQYQNGKFQNLLQRVIANPKTLEDAYNCIKTNGNVESSPEGDKMPYDSLANELFSGTFDVKANVYSISSRGNKKDKELLVLPNLKLKVVKEAIRIALETVYKPHFSKISYGCRSGRGHSNAIKYICSKEISSPDWWFTLLVNKKLDASILSKLISSMEDKIEDPKLYSLLRDMFDAQVLNLEFGSYPKGHGLPQEGILSPILMNIYLDMFDKEFYKLSMKYEALDENIESESYHSKLRSWFRGQIKEKSVLNETCGVRVRVRVHCCRFMDEIFFAASGPRHVALAFKSEVQNYLQSVLFLDVDQNEISTCNKESLRFLGILIERRVKETAAVRAVHKLKEKVKLFAEQKQEYWEVGTARIGKKWLAHGLKKVKESEIKHLEDRDSVLSRISCSYRKTGMETDHWYKALVKTWMMKELVNVRLASNEEFVLSKFVVEPSLPKELRDSFHEFQNRVDEYFSSETASTASLLPNSCEAVSSKTEAVAPVNVIRKRLQRYGLINAKGFPCASRFLILQDNTQIIDWFSGVIIRWLRWYRDCSNFNDVKVIICDQVRKSCIRTLAAKHRIDEHEIEKLFDSELSRIPLSEEEMENDIGEENNEELMYGLSNSGLCLLSLARMVNPTRPCNCFVFGCSEAAPSVYLLHVMERQKFPGWKTGFSSCIHPSLNKRKFGLCRKHLKDLYFGHISLQSINFGSW
ncbi:nuclear intron maturase 4, mitochondrial [Impatiens glandulifera]|uniref:nuclear intron maturase 4, mitochondrial n=1 Tax=Impatiens glandulifera TaxID=253017 RepID=UPI001FB131E1|nr:nuclear intron maturase 4, mitochondrial [Impatiens glandulifera]XP_047311504.1 nuclear intron maturase 4, mitochondrial [Impatiens glandulifera]XP_047311505.1 nuclear intron maturase 4, mitochondrial [Impatiens glandulifera]